MEGKNYNEVKQKGKEELRKGKHFFMMHCVRIIWGLVEVTLDRKCHSLYKHKNSFNSNSNIHVCRSRYSFAKTEENTVQYSAIFTFWNLTGHKTLRAPGSWAAWSLSEASSGPASSWPCSSASGSPWGTSPAHRLHTAAHRHSSQRFSLYAIH